MSEAISNRATALFQDAHANTIEGINRVKVEQASKGMLASGITIQRFVDVHEVVSREAIAKIVESVGRRVESRGFRWRRMIGHVRRELVTYLTDAEKSVNRELNKVVLNGPQLATPLFEAVRQSLYRELDDYEKGWSGTPGRSWIERNKVLYTILVALGGAALTVATGIASKLIEAALTFPTEPTP